MKVMPGILAAFCIHMQLYLPSITECFILHQNNAASSDTHFSPWFKGSSFANLWNRVKSCFLISRLREWESPFAVSMENFHTLIIPPLPKRIKVLMILNQSDHINISKNSMPSAKKKEKKRTRNTCWHLLSKLLLCSLSFSSQTIHKSAPEALWSECSHR